MRQFWMAACIASLATLTACAGYQTQTTAPTVSYNYADDDDYEEIAERADEYCEDRYHKNATLKDRDKTDTGYEATFSCE